MTYFLELAMWPESAPGASVGVFKVIGIQVGFSATSLGAAGGDGACATCHLVPSEPLHEVSDGEVVSLAT